MEWLPGTHVNEPEARGSDATTNTVLIIGIAEFQLLQSISCKRRNPCESSERYWGKWDQRSARHCIWRV